MLALIDCKSLSEKAQQRVDFLKALFDKAEASEYIEIREIGEKRKQYFLKLNSLYCYEPPLNANVYFGVFSRIRKSGKAEACSTTRALFADFDFKGITLNERLNEVQIRIKNANLPVPSILVNSGNGIHVYWLLKERADSEALGILKAISRATGSDPRVAEKARIMRLPYTFNVKDPATPLWCEVVQADYSLKYDLSVFQEALRDYIRDTKKEPSKGDCEAFRGIQVDKPCVAKMLKGVCEGERNFALGRITKYLQLKGYAKQKAQEIVLAWNRRNKPPEAERKILNDFEYYWANDYKLLGCMIDNPELQQMLYKYCSRPECSFTAAVGHIKLDNHIRFNNRLLQGLDRLTGNDLIVYGVLSRHGEGLTTSLLFEKLTSKATGKICISRPTLFNSLKVLKQLGFIEVLEGNRRAGKENFYKAKVQGTYGLGYTLVSNGAINGAIDGRISPAEFKLYVLLLKYAFHKGNCYPSLSTLAKELRVSSEFISMALKNLEKADYIKRYYKPFNGTEKLFIKLLV